MKIDFATARQRMVDNQVRTTDVTSHPLLDALLSVAREDFVPEGKKPLAYIDSDIELSSAGRFVLEPSPLAKLLQTAEFSEKDKVLEVGTGSGYNAAVISKMVTEVVALESDPDLANTATETLTKSGYDNVSVVSGALQAGHKASAPYDVIFVSGAIEIEPATLFDQLAEGGRMVAVIGHGGAAQAKLYRKENGHVSSRKMFNVSIPAIPGFEREAEFIF